MVSARCDLVSRTRVMCARARARVAESLGYAHTRTSAMDVGHSCAHGHAVASVDGISTSCVCAYGWNGTRCDIDVLQDCAAERHATEAFVRHQANDVGAVTVGTFRFRWLGAPWTCDLLPLLNASQISCGCLTACYSYLEFVHGQIVAATQRPFARRIPLAWDDPLPTCSARNRDSFVAGSASTISELRTSLSLRAPLLDGRAHLLSQEPHVSAVNCFANCRGRGVCVRHFCECERGAVGSTCRAPRQQPPSARASAAGGSSSVTVAGMLTRMPTRTEPAPAELRVQLLELPAAVQYEFDDLHSFYSRGGRHYSPAALFEKRAVYWSQGYLYSHIAADDSLVTDAGDAQVLVSLDSGFDLDRAAVQRFAGKPFEWVVLLTRAPSDVPRAFSEARAVRMHPYCPRPSASSPRLYPVSAAFHPDRDVCLPPLIRAPPCA